MIFHFFRTLRGVIRRAHRGRHADRPSGRHRATHPVARSSEPVTELGWDNSPEGIASWLDSLPTLMVTPAEEVDTAAWRKQMSDYGIVKMESGIEDVFR